MITVHVKTGARLDSLVGTGRPDEYLATVRARPIEGEANRAIVQLLSDELNLPKSMITLSSGEKAKVKRFIINK